jgi:O-6-methylguanine DNA methyltransferase
MTSVNLVIDRLSKTYSNGVRALNNVSLEIPPGEVRPYSWIAREIGRPGAVRATGSALAKNPVPLLIPCHRVVRSDGRIGKYSATCPRNSVSIRT